MILLISAFWVARIAGMSHQHLAWEPFYVNTSAGVHALVIQQCLSPFFLKEYVSFSLLGQTPERNNLKGGRICFGSQFWGFSPWLWAWSEAEHHGRRVWWVRVGSCEWSCEWILIRNESTSAVSLVTLTVYSEWTHPTEGRVSILWMVVSDLPVVQMRKHWTRILLVATLWL
jgi:hypothetical protein